MKTVILHGRGSKNHNFNEVRIRSLFGFIFWLKKILAQVTSIFWFLVVGSLLVPLVVARATWLALAPLCAVEEEPDPAAD